MHGKTKQLLEIVKLLAQPSDMQINFFPEFVCVADELALNFGDSFECVTENEAIAELSKESYALLGELNQILDDMSENEDLWSNDSLRDGREWASIRLLSRKILIDIGVELTEPKIDWIKFIS